MAPEQVAAGPVDARPTSMRRRRSTNSPRDAACSTSREGGAVRRSSATSRAPGRHISPPLEAALMKALRQPLNASRQRRAVERHAGRDRAGTAVVVHRRWRRRGGGSRRALVAVASPATLAAAGARHVPSARFRAVGDLVNTTADPCCRAVREALSIALQQSKFVNRSRGIASSAAPDEPPGQRRDRRSDGARPLPARAGTVSGSVSRAEYDADWHPRDRGARAGSSSSDRQFETGEALRRLGQAQPPRILASRWMHQGVVSR